MLLIVITVIKIFRGQNTVTY